MRSFYAICLIALFAGCEVGVELDLEQAPPKIVIEGRVTDRPADQVVKLSRSTGFYGAGTTPRITDASVVVRDDEGTVYSFVHNPRNHADSSGIYVPATPFAGQTGRTYTLTVTVDGDEYSATDRLLSVIPIDSLQYRVNPFQQDNPQRQDKIYEILMFAREPQDDDNYYLFHFYRNDSLTFYNDTDIYYTDDAFLAEQIDGVPSPVYFATGDVGRVEVFSLSRTAYVYFNDLWALLNNDGGGMFGPIPSSPRTNLTNGALGFFQVSAVKSKEIKVE